jgi:hypothetical protein
VFGNDDLLDTARRQPAAGPPATLGESITSTFNQVVTTDTSAGIYFGMRDAYARYLDEVRTMTGETLFNPMDASDPLGDMGTVSGTLRARAEAEAELQRSLGNLRDAHPTLPVRTPLDIRGEVEEQRRRARAARGEVASRETSTWNDIGAFLGAAGAVMVDPPVAASMAFGAPVATGILRAALIEAGAAGLSEAIVQTSVQASRPAFSEAPSLAEAAVSVGAATGGAAILSPLVRGAAIGARELVDRAGRLKNPGAEVKAARDYLTRKLDLEDLNPYGDTPEGMARHVENLDEALIAAREGRVSNVSETARFAEREAEPAANPTLKSDLDDDLSLDGAAGKTADETLEADIRRLALERPDMRMTMEEAGELRTMTTRELVETMDRDRDFVATISECLRAR